MHLYLLVIKIFIYVLILDIWMLKLVLFYNSVYLHAFTFIFILLKKFVLCTVPLTKQDTNIKLHSIQLTYIFINVTYDDIGL